MSIKVNIRMLTPWRKDAADIIRVEKLNEVATDYAQELANELGPLKCSHHPEQDSYVTVIADRANYMIIEKQFCCIEFEKKVGLKISH